MRPFNTILVSSDPNVPGAKQLISGSTLSGSFTTAPVSLVHIKGYAVDVYTSGATLTGSVELQCSNDPGYELNHSGIVHWNRVQDTVAGSTSLANLSGSSDIHYNVVDAYYKWFRVAYTHGSGTGSIDIYANGKGES